MTPTTNPIPQSRWRAGLVVALVALLGAPAAGACTPDYRVVPGDTLSSIALDQLGTIFAYPRIHEANRVTIGEDPDAIRAGQTLAIPCASPEARRIDWSVIAEPETIQPYLVAWGIQVLDIRPAIAGRPGRHPARRVVGTLSPLERARGQSRRPPVRGRAGRAAVGAGIDPSEPVLVVHGKDNPMDVGRAARVYWLLKSSGAGQIAILRGGFAAWTRAELPVAEGPAVPIPAPVEIEFARDWFADAVDVYGIATDQIEGRLLDARPHGIFAKMDDFGNALATTLPGAQSTPAPPLLATLKGEIDIEAGALRVIDYFAENDVAYDEGITVSFCHSGELAALNWFYASELAGLPGMKLYPDSVQGWTEMGGLLVPPEG